MDNMKSLSKISFSIMAMTSILFATGCAQSVSHNITAQGTVENRSDLVFPKPDTAWQKGGIFPNQENISKIRSGVTKDDIYQLIGHPHFNEAQHAIEWDYIFKFYQPDNHVQTCQYKILFDRTYIARQFYWLPEDCARYAENYQPMMADKPIITDKMSLQTDALFPFDQWQIHQITQTGQEKLNQLAEKLRQYQNQGDVRVIITGYTDRLGSTGYNLNLSQLRAQSVRQYLINQGVDGAILSTAGAGAANPVKQCSNQLSKAQLIQCLQPNRRVEVAVAVYQFK